MLEGLVVIQLVVELLLGVEVGEIEAAHLMGELGSEACVGEVGGGIATGPPDALHLSAVEAIKPRLIVFALFGVEAEIEGAINGLQLHVRFLHARRRCAAKFGQTGGSASDEYNDAEQ